MSGDIELAKHSDLDIDLVMDLLWKKKLVILSTTIVFAIAGFAYSKLVEPKYTIEMPYRVNYDCISMECSDLQSLMSGIKFAITEELPDGVVLTISLDKFIFRNSKTKNTSQYLSLLNQQNSQTSKSILKRNLAILDLLRTEAVIKYLETDFLARVALHAGLNTKKIEEGAMILLLGEARIRQTAPNEKVITSLFMLLGGFFLSVLLVIIDIAKRRNILSKSN